MGCYCSITSCDIKSHPECLLNLRKYVNNYDWSGLEFPLSIKEISKFEKKNNTIVNVLGAEERKVHILRGEKHNYQKKVVNLLLIANHEKRHYTTVKDLSRLVTSSNSRHRHKQHFCMNRLQGFHSEESRDNHFKYCKDNEIVRIEMPKKGLFVKFHDGQNQFKVPLVMYADFESILNPIESSEGNPEELYTEIIN